MIYTYLVLGYKRNNEENVVAEHGVLEADNKQTAIGIAYDFYYESFTPEDFPITDIEVTEIDWLQKKKEE